MAGDEKQNENKIIRQHAEISLQASKNMLPETRQSEKLRGNWAPLELQP